MWPKVIIFLTLLGLTMSEYILSEINRELREGVKSIRYNIVFGDEDINVINETVDDLEKLESLKPRINLMEVVPPLPTEDVKCLMSKDLYCSKEMLKMKGILIRGLKEECFGCSVGQRESAGKVIASMLAHDPVAWKIFLTRYGGRKRYSGKSN